MSDKKTVAQSAPSGGAVAALAALAAIGLQAQQQLVAAQALEPNARRHDETVPGGRYIGADGQIHDAHGNTYDTDGNVVGVSAAVTGAAVLASVRSEEELDALQAQLESRREALKAARETAARGGSQVAEGPSKQKESTANLPSGDEETTSTAFHEMSSADLKAEIEKRGIQVTGSGKGGKVSDEDRVRALQLATGQPVTVGAASASA
jgi:type II secretory pathway pseudopilin PulG